MNYFFMAAILFLTQLNNLSAAEDSSKLIPDIFKNIEPSFVMDGKFSSSCGPNENASNDNYSSFSLSAFPANNYFFFSLTQHLIDSKLRKHEYRFFKDKALKGLPEYILDEEGLKEKGILKCPWNYKYSEDFLAGKVLNNCSLAKDMMAYYYTSSNMGGR